jgi:hypothetical protein
MRSHRSPDVRVWLAPNVLLQEPKRWPVGPPDPQKKEKKGKRARARSALKDPEGVCLISSNCE